MRVKWILIASGMTAVASSAGAQVSCSTVGNYTTCDGGLSHNPGSDLDQVMRAGEAGRNAVPDYNASELEAARAREMNARAALEAAQAREMNARAGGTGMATGQGPNRKQQEKANAEQAFLMAAETTGELPPPSDEQPVLLNCTIDGSPATIALYEKHSRVDTTFAGVTNTRTASFSNAAVTWNSPVIRSSLNRLGGSYVGYGNIPQVKGQSIAGKCAVAAKRSF